MKTAYFSTILFLFFGSQSIAQMEIDGQLLYGNEWINYDQSYQKLKVANDGLYRISFAELQNSGFSVNDSESSFLQLYKEGKEQPIYIGDDYIEFYGEKNRGEIDKQLYANPDRQQLNPEYSMYNDTTAYFLTVGDREGVRMNELENALFANPAESHYTHRDKIVFSEYHFKPTHNGPDKIRYSNFDVGEGYGSTLRAKTNLNFDASEVYEQGPVPKIKVRFSGTSVNHRIRLFNTVYR